MHSRSVSEIQQPVWRQMSIPIFSVSQSFPEAADPILCSLLENDYFLSKVLEHLVDDGLHECRRVCQRWRSICGSLPLKLCLYGPEKLAATSELFPNTTSVSFCATSNDQSAEIGQLVSFRQLRYLRFGVGWNSNLLLFSSLLPSFECLQSLSVLPGRRHTRAEQPELRELYSSLGHLTNLTELNLKLNGCDVLVDFQPLTQLTKIRSLSLIRAPFYNSEKQLLFQPTSNLTSLDLLPFFDVPNEAFEVRAL